MRGRLQYLTICVLVTIWATANTFAQTAIQNGSKLPIRLVEIELARINLGSTDISPGESITLSFKASFEYTPSGDNITSSAMSSYINELARNIIVEDIDGLGLLPATLYISSAGKQINNSLTKNSIEKYYVEGNILISGKVVSNKNILTGQKLNISIRDPISGYSSRPVQLYVSGLSDSIWFKILLTLIGLGGVTTTLLAYRRMQTRFAEAQAELSHRSLQFESFREQSDKVSARDRPVELVPKVPELLLEELANSQAILGVGSGLSEYAGFQDWRGILMALHDSLQDRLSPSVKRLFVETIRSKEREIDVNDLSDLMDAIMSRLGRDDLVSALSVVLNVSRGFRLQLHNQLSRMPWSGVLSLTLDNVGREVFLECFASSSGLPYESIEMLPADGRDLRVALQKGNPFYLDALGDIRHPDKVSLSLSEIRNSLTRSPEFARQTALLLDTRSFLFVGVSAGALKEYLQSFHPNSTQSRVRHFALVPFDPNNDRFVDTLGRFGVQLLEYDDIADKEALPEFISSLENQLDNKKSEFRIQSDAHSGLNREISTQRLKSIKLNNIGPFKNLLVEFSELEMPNSARNWTVILGENGIGKTIVLRAVAIALTAGESSVAAAAGDLLSYGEERGSITLELGKQTLHVELSRDRSGLLKSRQASPVEAGQILVLGFPAMRGAPSGDPTGPTTQSRNPPEPNDLLPLINNEIDPRMTDFKQWIVNVINNSHKDPTAKAIRGLLDEIIADLVPGDFLGFDDLDVNHVLRLRSSDPNLPSVPISTVSQGMSSIFNWVGVLLKRLYEVFEVDHGARPHQHHAIVLIDEIDVHLHPDWQRRLVSLSKRHFPNVQIIATTHSALIASSVQASEIRIIERHPDGQLVSRAPDIATYGKSADFIMQSDVLGMANARPLEVEKLIIEYKGLYGKHARSKAEDERFFELSEELADIGWSGVSVSGKQPRKEITNEDLSRVLRSYKE